MTWLSRLVIAGLLAGLAVLMVGCPNDVEEAPPTDRAREGLEQAEQSLEQLQQRYDQLGERIQQREQRIDEHMQTHLRLIDLQLDRLRETTFQLPAEFETDLRQNLEQLEARRNQAEGSMSAYLNAPTEQAPQLREQFEQQLEQLQQETEVYEARLMEAHERAMETTRPAP